MMIRFQRFKNAIDVTAITHIFLGRKKTLSTCVSGTKVSAADSFLQHIPLKQREQIFFWLNPSILPTRLNDLIR